jgi:hypothetical protein
VEAIVIGIASYKCLTQLARVSEVQTLKQHGVDEGQSELVAGHRSQPKVSLVSSSIPSV